MAPPPACDVEYEAAAVIGQMLSSRKIPQDFLDQKTDEKRIASIVNSDLLKHFQKLISSSKQSAASLPSERRSSELRRNADDKLVSSALVDAVRLYDECIFYAAEDTPGLAMGYSNRSLAFLKLKQYESCCKDVDHALSTNKYPNERKYKLLLRKAKCCKELNNVDEALAVLKVARSCIPSNMDILEGCCCRKALMEEISQAMKELDGMQMQESSSKALWSAASETCLLGAGENPIIDGASRAVELQWNPTSGRYLRAKQNICKGEVVLVERPYALVLLPDFYSTRCYHCLAQLQAIVYCKRRCEVRYCSAACREGSWKSYHSLECDYLPILKATGIGHLAHRTVAVTGLQRLMAKCHGESVPHEAPIDGLNPGTGRYSTDYHSVYSLMTNSELILPQDMYHYAATAVLLLQCLKEAGFFMSSKCDGQTLHVRPGDTEWVLYVGVLLLRHIQQLICNAHAITETVDECSEGKVYHYSDVRLASAIYPCASLMNHSCDPSIMSSFCNDILVVKAVKNIAAGDEIYNCYGPHFLRMDRPERLDVLKSQYYFDCRCSACSFEAQPRHKAIRCPGCSGPAIVGDSTAKCGECGHEIPCASLIDDLSRITTLVERARQDMCSANYKDALAKLLQARTFAVKTLYEHNIDQARIADMTAQCYARLGNFKQAAKCLRESVTTVEAVYGDESVEAANEYRKFVEVLCESGEPPNEMLALAKKAKRIFACCFAEDATCVREAVLLEANLEQLLQLSSKETYLSTAVR